MAQRSDLPYEAIPYDQIGAKDFLPALKIVLGDAKRALGRLKNSKKEANFVNSVLPLEKIFARIYSVIHPLGPLANAEMNDDTNKVNERVDILFKEFENDLYFDERIFERVRVVYENMNGLDPDQKRLTEIYYDNFLRKGTLLSAEHKQRIKEIERRLIELSEKFKVNLQKATNNFVLKKRIGGLDGLPKDFLEKAKEEAEKREMGEGFYAITLQPASVTAVLKHADDRDLRRDVYFANNSRAYGGEFDNQEIVKEIACLRHEKARLLDYNTHGEFVVQDRMAENTENVLGMINRVVKYAKPKMQKELAELSAIASLDWVEQLEPHDVLYYFEKLKKAKYDISEEDLKPYFELENTIYSLLKMIKIKYGYSFRKVSLPTWNKDVRVYEVRNQNNKYSGLLYMDLFARETKRGGAWADFVKPSLYNNGCLTVSHVGIFCNFAKLDKVFLTMNQCKTLFHEFGHAISQLVSKPRYPSLGSFFVQWDMVELASQLEENWIRHKEALSLFAYHYKTGRPIPVELIERLKEMENINVGYISMRQIVFTGLDVYWHHICDPNTVKDVAEFEKDVLFDLYPLMPIKGTCTSCSFSHIFSGGYSFGYYVYSWAEMLEADVFSLFEKNGIFHKETCENYRDQFLARGNERPAIEVYEDFMGKKPNLDALLRRYGFIE